MLGEIIRIGVKSKANSIDQGKVGLPKMERIDVEVKKNGLEGDYNHYRFSTKKNTPDRAVLLITIEMIETLNTEGWPIQAGDLGENITTKGIDYHKLKTGSQLKIGKLIVTITEPCNPCANLFTLPYIGKEKGSQFLKILKGRRGWYCKVNQEGKITKGDEIELLE